MTRVGVIADLPLEVDPRATRVRLYTHGLSLVDEALAGVRLTAPVDMSITATAYDNKGRVVAVSDPFKTSAGPDRMVTLSAMFPAAGLVGDAPWDMISSRRPQFGKDGLEMPRGGRAAEVLIFYRPKVEAANISRQRALEHKPPSAFEENFFVRARAKALISQSVAASGLLFPGPNEKLRLALYPLHRDRRRPKQRFDVLWSEAHSSGFALPSFVFHDEQLDRAIAAVRYRNASLLGPLLDAVLAGEDHQLDHIGANLALLIAGFANIDNESRWEQLDKLSECLTERLAIPDAWVLRAEILARMGWHRKAKASLRKVRSRQLPWTTTALKLLAQRLSYYDTEERVSTWTYRKRWYQNLLGMAHPACVFCVLELPGAVTPP